MRRDGRVGGRSVGPRRGRGGRLGGRALLRLRGLLARLRRMLARLARGARGGPRRGGVRAAEQLGEAGGGRAAVGSGGALGRADGGGAISGHQTVPWMEGEADSGAGRAALVAPAARYSAAFAWTRRTYSCVSA